MQHHHSLTALLAVLSLSSAGRLFAQDTLCPIILSPRVGPVIHAETRSQYHLFSQIQRFDSAMVLRDSKGNYGACVMYTRKDGLITDTVIGYTPSDVSRMSEQIEHQEGIRSGRYHIGDTMVTPVVGDRDSIPIRVRTAVSLLPESDFPVQLESRRGSQITAFTRGGYQITGELLRIRHGELLVSWGKDLADTTLAKYLDRIIRVPVEDIVTVKIHGQSKLGSGMIIGFVSGACLGALMGASGGDDRPNELFSMTAGQKAFVGGTLAGLGGLLLGAIIGGASSTSDKMIDYPSADTLMLLQSNARYSVEEPSFLKKLI